MDMERNAQLRARAREYARELSLHPVLSRHIGQLSLILKGSTARGYSDRYSDIDLVLFCEAALKPVIVSDYIEGGFSQREDGIFLPLGDWEGHYNLETYQHVEEAYARGDMESIWEYHNVELLWDPEGRYQTITSRGIGRAFADEAALLRDMYLQIQLNLDWMRQPLRRADRPASAMYVAKVLGDVCRLAFLLKGMPYPCVKWLFYEFSRLELDPDFQSAALQYASVFSELDGLRPDQDLMDYPAYRKADQLVSALKAMLEGRLGAQPWIEEWYYYA